VPSSRITLQNQELLTSNMLVRCFISPLLLRLSYTPRNDLLLNSFSTSLWLSLRDPCHFGVYVWIGSLVCCLNLLLGALRVENSSLLSPLSLLVFFGNLTGSLFFAAILVRCGSFFFTLVSLIGHLTRLSDSGIVSGPPYHDYIQAFAMWAICWGCKEKVNSSRILFFQT